MGQSKEIIESESILPVNIRVSKNLQKLTDDIKKGKTELQKTLSELDSSTFDADLKRNFIGILTKKSVEKNLEKLFSDLSNYIGRCGIAIQKSNDNLARSLELIKLLALVEKELYDHIDDQIVSNNELKDIISDWFEKEGINDDEVRELIDTSFLRAYTLRDRINNLRTEFETCLSLFDQRIQIFETRHIQLDEKISKLIHEASEKLNSALTKNIKAIQELSEERSNAIISLSLSSETQLKAIVSSFEDTSDRQKKEIAEDLSSINKLYSDIQNETTTALDTINKREGSVIKTLEDRHQEINSNLELQLQDFEGYISTLRNEFSQKIQTMQKSFDVEKKLLRKEYRNKFFIAGILAIAVSAVTSFAICYLL